LSPRLAFEASSSGVLADHYTRRLIEFGDNAQGAFWPNEADRRTRFDVMLDVMSGDSSGPLTLCDLGCGTGELLAHMRRRGMDDIAYTGADISTVALTHARAKFPEARFVEIDVNASGADLDSIACDYLVADGVFTAKFDLSHEAMWALLQETIERVWPHVRRGIAFNVMSKAADWERDDLFHVPMDDIARMLHRLAGRRVRFRADYGLYEYTAYAFKPNAAVDAGADRVASTAAIETKQGASRRTRSARASTGAAAQREIPVLRPLLPDAGSLAPYLRRIDATRIYSNHGPLSQELERRLAQHLALPQGGIACASSGAAALTGAILATAGPALADRPLALMPAFTFVATAHAAERCGYRCALADIDPQTWMLNPERLTTHPALSEVGVVIPVAAFGRPVPQAPWRAFAARTGIPVVIDGAASFDRLEAAPEPFLGAIPVVMSFHATKSFASGEGGCVASNDLALMRRIVQALNFGFHDRRVAESAAINGKMSEFHAAVGLAEFDSWADKRAAFANVVDCYRQKMQATSLERSFVGAPDVGLSYALLRCHDSDAAERAQGAMALAGVGSRLWYGLGLHRQAWFATVVAEPLPATDALAPCIIGLPYAPDLEEDHVDIVVDAIDKALTSAR
jgi:dTDP-4-amino-4,6-dideoxygalactose transaminase/SAM-dependent methyltransferase